MTTLTALFVTISSQVGLPPGLLSSLCYVESKHKINAIHHDDGDQDSLGVCQIKLTSARQMGFRGTAKQLMEPRYNVKYAARYLKYQISRYNNSITKGVIAYNLGNARGLTSTKYQRRVFRKWRQE